jgi:two-component system, cell cycle response regulator
MNSNGTILVAEDQKVMRETIAMMLHGHNYHLEFAANGLDALAKAEKLIPDLILLDIMMPGIDGLEVCRRLRRHPILSQVPIIIITALADRESWMRGMQAGADDYVFKPFDTAELRTRIRNVIQLNRYRSLMVERAKFEWVVKQTEEGVISLDERQRIVYANKQARAFLDLPADDAPLNGGEPFMEAAGRRYFREPREAWVSWPAETPEGMIRYLLRPEAVSSPAFWLQVDSVQLSGAGADAYLVRLRDVTDEMSLRQEVWRFQSMVLHKMRTPLIAIMNGYELLLRHHKQIKPEEIRELAEGGLAGAKRLRSDLEDIRQFLHAPNLAQGGEGFLVESLTAVVHKLSEQLNLPPITIGGPEKLPPMRLRLNGQAFEAILYELLENSQKFHPQNNPQVQIFAFQSADAELTMWVGDDGVNLPPDQLTQIWTPYYQAEKRFTGEVSGMGLGLPTVASVIWSVGGRCRMYNRTNAPGVVVELALPVELI